MKFMSVPTYADGEGEAKEEVDSTTEPCPTDALEWCGRAAAWGRGSFPGADLGPPHGGPAAGLGQHKGGAAAASGLGTADGADPGDGRRHRSWGRRPSADPRDRRRVRGRRPPVVDLGQRSTATVVVFLRCWRFTKGHACRIV